MRLLLLFLVACSFGLSCEKFESTNISDFPAKDLFLENLESSIVEFVNGQPDSFKSYWAETDNVTLAGGLGGEIAKGWPEISVRLNRVSEMYGSFSSAVFESNIVAMEFSDVYGYVVQHEKITIQDLENETEILRLYRTTMIFKNDGGEWKVIHRHADLHTLEESGLSGN